jgi:hypothetical protein
MRLRKRGESENGGQTEKEVSVSNASEKSATQRTRSETKHVNRVVDQASSFVTIESTTWDFPIIEVNPNCWLEKRGEFAAAARKHSLTYPELMEKIVGLALERRPRSAS